ncbi:hypothetical protein HHI36_016725, partial [Cryptolaemus montrouzieri]
HELISSVKKIANKSCKGYNRVPRRVLSSCIEIIAGPLAHIIGCSFRHGVFSNELMITVLVSLFKKR